MKIIIKVSLAASIAVLLFFSFGCTLPIVPKENEVDDAPVLEGPYEVIRIIDGDTIVVSIDCVETRVRLIGVNTPESVAPEEYHKDNVPEGKIASGYTKELLSGKKVYLEFDIQKFDDYGRTLAYVYLEDGTTMIQEVLLSEGLAQIMTIQPNSKYADEFAEIQKAARESGKGFWSN